MREKLYPYIIFLPKNTKRKVLKTIFGSKVPVDILRYALKKGLAEKLFQKEVINVLNYSNKTVIGHLRSLTEFRIFDENMEKSVSRGRTVWVKTYSLTDLGKWFALLMIEEESLTHQEKEQIARNAFRSYTRWLIELSEKSSINKQELSKIFEEEMLHEDSKNKLH